MKKEYESLEMEIIVFETEDVITTSCLSNLCTTETELIPVS